MASERNTPYKTAIFSERINSLRENTKAIYDFELSFVCVENIDTGKMVYDGPDMLKRRKCIEVIIPISEQLYGILIPTTTLWGDSTRKLIANYSQASGHLTACTHKWLLVGNKQIIGDKNPNYCEVPYQFRKELKQTRDIGKAVLKSMIDDMQDFSG